MRKSGILLPISSLPSKYGIGALSKEAYEFVDCLKASGQSYWQILPLGPTGYGDSPYQSFSTFAGNPYFIDLEEMISKGWITAEECEEYDFGNNDRYIDYEKMYLSRFHILKKAYERSKINTNRKFKEFIKENAFWLDDYALYMAVKNSFSGVSWTEWDSGIKLRKPDAMNQYRKKYKKEIEFYQFQQFVFAVQWNKLKRYANKKGIKIIGDIPIYVAFDSSDAWANPELFQFDESVTPIAVAGCPPDAFSATGQLWGNPLYNWEYHAETEYEWWIRRLRNSFLLYDVVRIDHFRGFDAYYSIPYGATDAVKGVWRKGPGFGIFKKMKEQLGEKEVIAEDLGFLTPSVLKLVRRSGYPGMKVLQFAFDSREESDYLPHNYINNCVVYTGTHDNDTVQGWFKSISKEDKEFCKKYLHLEKTKTNMVHWELIRAALSSVACMAVIPMQDYLGLGREARINTPSTLGNNWKWRMDKNAFTKELSEQIRQMTQLYGRV